MQIKKPEMGVAVRRALFPEIRSVNEDKRTITFVSSDESVDRYGDILRVSGWKYQNYLRNPIVLWSHRSGDPPIGKCIDLKIESSPRPALVQTVEFADAKTYPFADTIRKLYQGKFLNAVSVGFMPLESPTPISDLESHTVGYEYTSMDLLELSCVPLPANQNALARAIETRCFSAADLEKAFASGDELEAWKQLTAKSIDLAAAAVTIAEKFVREVLAKIKAAGIQPAKPSQDEEAVAEITLSQLCDSVKAAAAASVHTGSDPMPETIDDTATLEKHLAVLPKTTDDGDNTFFGAAELLRSRSIKMRKIDEE